MNHLLCSSPKCGLGDDEIGNIAAKFLNEEEHVDTSSLQKENDQTLNGEIFSDRLKIMKLLEKYFLTG